MKAIILAAGYATRMYPLTENFPKPLLPVNGKPILETILDDIQTIPTIDQIIVVSNHKFISIFQDWMIAYRCTKPLLILDDGSTSNDNRLGAVKDIAFAVDSCGIDDDILVLAGDNLYDFSMNGFVNRFHEFGKDMIMVHEETDVAKLQKTGVVELWGDHVVSFEEKPLVPKGTHTVPPFYLYRKGTLPLLRDYEKEGKALDAPGNLVAWLCRHVTVCAYPMSGKRVDIGDLATYHALNK